MAAKPGSCFLTWWCYLDSLWQSERPD